MYVVIGMCVEDRRVDGNFLVEGQVRVGISGRNAVQKTN
jgi:hypothetical protein